MATRQEQPSIDEYLRKRLMPVEGTIPHLAGIDMFGNSIPAGSVGGDLFEYINFQQRYNIDARVARALKLSTDYLDPLPKGQHPRNSVDAHVQWLKSKPGYNPVAAAEYRRAKASEQLRVSENLQELYTTAGVLLVDAQGHGIISAKIASTVHDTFHAFMLSELDLNGKTSPNSSPVLVLPSACPRNRVSPTTPAWCETTTSGGRSSSRSRASGTSGSR
jgi:hypothetical protein